MPPNKAPMYVIHIYIVSVSAGVGSVESLTPGSKMLYMLRYMIISIGISSIYYILQTKMRIKIQREDKSPRFRF